MKTNEINEKLILKRKEPLPKDVLYHPNLCIKEIIHFLFGKKINNEKKVSLKSLGILLPDVKTDEIFTLDGFDIDELPNEWINILNKHKNIDCEINHEEDVIVSLEELIK